ncbi:MAG: hypothetical protein ACE5I5_09065 [Candidatus Heimdallarchaeota archaeon]
MDNSNNDDRDNENDEEENEESSIRLPLKVGRVTELPKDLGSVPREIRLSDEFHKNSHEAWKCAKESGNEWGYFIHLDEEGQLIAGKLKEGTPHEWIRFEEYVKARKQDKTIQGLMHTHLEEETVFSPSNIGFFLAAKDSICKCMDPQGNYLIRLRTEQTDPPWEGIFEEATQAYTAVAREKTKQHIMENELDRKEAIRRSMVEAMIEVCKQYNIALYTGTSKKAAKKVG